MIDTDKCERILYNDTYKPIDVYNVAEELFAEVKRLREENERLKDIVEKANGYGSYDKEYMELI